MVDRRLRETDHFNCLTLHRPCAGGCERDGRGVLVDDVEHCDVGVGEAGRLQELRRLEVVDLAVGNREPVQTLH